MAVYLRHGIEGYIKDATRYKDGQPDAKGPEQLDVAVTEDWPDELDVKATAD